MTLGFGAIAFGAIGALPTAGNAAYAPTITCGNVATVAGAALPIPTWKIPGIAAVSFGTMTLPFLTAAVALRSFSPVTFSSRMTVLRFTPALRPQLVRMISFNPVKFGSMSL